MSLHAESPREQRTEQALEEALAARTPTRLSALPTLAKGVSLADGAHEAAAVVVPVATVPDDGAGADGAAGPGVPQPRRGAAEAAVSFEADVAAWAEVTSFAGRAGDLLTVTAPSRRGVTGGSGLPQRLIFLGVGDESTAALRTAGAALAKATAGLGTLRSSVVDGLAEPLQRAFAEGFLLGGYRPPRAARGVGPKPAASVLELTGASAEVLRTAAATARAVWLARDLANMPSNLKDPAWLATQAQRLADGSGLQLRIRDEQDLEREGFGGILAVGKGSASSPRLLELSYTPATGSGRHIVLVGKGITFDTGGLSLKPREAMVPMKTDMAGAGVVLAVLSAAAELGLPHRITGLLPLAENAIGASSYRPGDVVTVYGGTTVEIGNTDAEGRMVLADALAYAVAGLDPDVLVDIATLTGAASRGLGRRHAALYSNTPELVSAFEAAANGSGERVWHMPLAEVQEEYGFALESSVADISHIASAGSKVGGGSITAALFLAEFVADTPWVHLDIAGPARADKDEAEVTKGATGYGARLLLEFLRGAL